MLEKISKEYFVYTHTHTFNGEKLTIKYVYFKTWIKFMTLDFISKILCSLRIQKW